MGLPFIVVGAFFGFVLLALFIARFIFWCVSARATRKSIDTTESKDYNYDPSIFKEVPLNKMNYSHSVYSLSSQSTLNVLASTASFDNLATQTQGRTYRDAVTRASRNSLFISPTEMLQLNQYETPGGAGYLSNYDSPIDSPITPTNYSAREYKKRTSRPPSVYMDKMLDDDLDDFDMSSDSGSYDKAADEKV